MNNEVKPGENYVLPFENKSSAFEEWFNSINYSEITTQGLVKHIVRKAWAEGYNTATKTTGLF